MAEGRFNPFDPLGLFDNKGGSLNDQFAKLGKVNNPTGTQLEETAKRIERATIQSGLPVSHRLRVELENIERRLKDLRGEIAATSQAFPAGTPGRTVWERRTRDISQAISDITNAHLKVAIVEADFISSRGGR